MPTTVEDIVREVVAEVLRKPLVEVDLDMPVEEAADSLELSGIVVAIEQRVGIALDDTVVGRLRVLRDLVPIVEEGLHDGAGR